MYRGLSCVSPSSPPRRGCLRSRVPPETPRARVEYERLSSTAASRRIHRLLRGQFEVSTETSDGSRLFGQRDSSIESSWRLFSAAWQLPGPRLSSANACRISVLRVRSTAFARSNRMAASMLSQQGQCLDRSVSWPGAVAACCTLYLLLDFKLRTFYFLEGVCGHSSSSSPSQVLSA